MTDTWTHTGYAQQVLFGPGMVQRIPGVLRQLGVRRVMLVTTPGRAASTEGEAVQRLIGRALSSTFADVRSHVPAPSVQEAVRQARRDAVDAVVSFGGGSCADLAKAVCWFTEQAQGTPGGSWADRPVIPHLAIPTTYSGAELTPFFGMTDPATGQKSGAGGPTTAPLAAIYDPELTVSTPSRVSAETGMNALAHCVEAAWSRTRTPEAEAIALSGASRIVEALPRVVARPGEMAARTDMLAGSALAGRCLQNAGMGVHHGLAQLLGGRTGISHGIANALILAHAVRFNAGAVPTEVRRIGESIGAPDDAAQGIADLVTALGLPSRLSDVGVTEEDLDAVAASAGSNHSVQANPRPVTEDDARGILSNAF